MSADPEKQCGARPPPKKSRARPLPGPGARARHRANMRAATWHLPLEILRGALFRKGVDGLNLRCRRSKRGPAELCRVNADGKEEDLNDVGGRLSRALWERGTPFGAIQYVRKPQPVLFG